MKADEFSSRWLSLEPALYRVAFYMLESGEDAQDVVQDLFVKLWSRRELLDNVSNPKSYCITLVRNRCIDIIRREQRTPRIELPSDPPGAEGLEDGVVAKETLSRVIRALEKLPKSQKAVLEMRVFEELSYEEISERTGMNNLTLRVLLSQARRTLKNVL